MPNTAQVTTLSKEFPLTDDFPVCRVARAERERAHMEQLRNLTIEFLEDSADGLRLVSQSNTRHDSIGCLLSSREALSGSLGGEAVFKWLDVPGVPGVYLLIGSPEVGSAPEGPLKERLYVGQADSVADRLGSHLKDRHFKGKSWWHTAVVIRRPDKNPLNLTQCSYLESELYSRALSAQDCELVNKVAPQLPNISLTEKAITEDFLQQAIVIVTAMGCNFFQQPAIRMEVPTAPRIITGDRPKVPFSLGPLLEEVRKAVTGPLLPRAEWYPTGCDYRAKVVADGPVRFRVFCRVKLAKKWLWLHLADVGKYKIVNTSELEKLCPTIEAAYKKAEQYLQRGK